MLDCAPVEPGPGCLDPVRKRLDIIQVFRQDSLSVLVDLAEIFPELGDELVLGRKRFEEFYVDLVPAVRCGQRTSIVEWRGGSGQWLDRSQSSVRVSLTSQNIQLGRMC